MEEDVVEEDVVVEEVEEVEAAVQAEFTPPVEVDDISQWTDYDNYFGLGGVWHP